MPFTARPFCRFAWLVTAWQWQVWPEYDHHQTPTSNILLDPKFIQTCFVLYVCSVLGPQLFGLPCIRLHHSESLQTKFSGQLGHCIEQLVRPFDIRIIQRMPWQCGRLLGQYFGIFDIESSGTCFVCWSVLRKNTSIFQVIVYSLVTPALRANFDIHDQVPLRVLYVCVCVCGPHRHTTTGHNTIELHSYTKEAN